MTYSEPQALIFHHTVAAVFFLYCKTTIIRVHTKQARTRSTFNEIFFFSREDQWETLLPLQSVMVVNRDARHK